MISNHCRALFFASSMADVYVKPGVGSSNMYRCQESSIALQTSFSGGFYKHFQVLIFYLHTQPIEFKESFQKRIFFIDSIHF